MGKATEGSDGTGGRPGDATSINTTRSNIKTQGVAAPGPVAGAGSGSGADESEATEATEGSDGTGDGPGEATTINTTRDNIKTQGVAAPESGAGAGEAGIAIKEQGVSKSGFAGGLAADGEPIPGIDIKLGKPGKPGFGAGPVRPTSPGPTYPDDTAPTD